MATKIGRNEPCPCGSGKKYKTCCLGKYPIEETTKRPTDSVLRIRSQTTKAEPYLPLVPSIIANGYRWRAVFNRLYYRPIKETFHEFLVRVAFWTFGRSWYKQQLSSRPSDRHVVAQWMEAFSEHRESPGDYEVESVSGKTVYSMDAPVPVWNLVSLGYDLFCLQAVNRLPDFLVKRLKKMRSFQSVRYEIAVPAILTRSGFDIDFLDEQGYMDKHCEFIGTHKNSGYKIGVEAKSRKRDLVSIGENYDYAQDWKGIYNLIRKAKKQAPPNLPFAIFIDVNLPPSPGVEPDKKPWHNEIKMALLPLGKPTIDNPDPFSILVPTNFCNLYAGLESISSGGEWGLVHPRFPKFPFPDEKLIRTLWSTISRYMKVPREI